jgi:hypothetical protein
MSQDSWLLDRCLDPRLAECETISRRTAVPGLATGTGDLCVTDAVHSVQTCRLSFPCIFGRHTPWVLGGGTQYVHEGMDFGKNSTLHVWKESALICFGRALKLLTADMRAVS